MAAGPGPPRKGGAPRVWRAVVPNGPHHVVQGEHHRQAVFAAQADFAYSWQTWAEFKAEYTIQAYGCCLLTKQARLVLQPGERVAGLGQLMKRLGGRSDPDM